MSDAESTKALRLQRRVVAEEWSVYKEGAEDSAHIAARELAIGYLELEEDLRYAIIAMRGQVMNCLWCSGIIGAEDIRPHRSDCLVLMFETGP